MLFARPESHKKSNHKTQIKRKRSLKNESKEETLISPEINNLVDLISISESGKKYTNIDAEIIKNILPYIKELNALIGMKKLKETVLLQILYFLQKFHVSKEPAIKKRKTDVSNSEYLHTVIYGEAGCGKTEVAMILGKIYASLGLLSTGSFSIVNRAGLIGEYLGHTAIKTLNVLQSCLGGDYLLMKFIV